MWGDVMYQNRLNKNLDILSREIKLLNRQKQSRFFETKDYIQHGRTSVYRHCIAVAYISCMIAAKLNLVVEIHQLIRGALLHDYFLYDWHEHDSSHRLHGFTHPKKALRNAVRDFNLSETERDIIKKHMFPLTIVPPAKKESWIVTAADKYCAIRETMNRKKRNF